MDKVYNKESTNNEEQIDENMGLSDIIDILNTLDYNSPGSNETLPTCPTNKTNNSQTMPMPSPSGPSSPSISRIKHNQSPDIESKLSEKSEKVKKPYIKIVEQPANKALRFRYECEGRSAGSIPGANSTSEIKTYPVIEIANYKGEVTLVVSCVTKDPPYRPHPHNLVGKEGCVHGVYTVRIKGDPPRAVLNNLGVQCVRRKDIKAALELRESKNIDPFKTKFAHKDQPSGIDLNVVRLCFQAFIQTGPRQFKKLQPVVSEPVYDRKAVSNLAINRLCSCSAKVSGGDEIIMLCEKVTKEIKIKFYELNSEGYEIWHDYAEFHHSDIHKNTAIAFKTPPYPNATDLTQRIQVYIQLERPSDGATSEPLPFEYYPDQDQIKRKRLKSGINAINILRRELQKHEQKQNVNDVSPNSNIWNVTPATTPANPKNVQTVINTNLPDIKPEGIHIYQNFGSHRNSYIEMSSPSPQPLSPMNRNIGTPSPSNLIMKTSSGGSQTQMMNSFNRVTIQSFDGMEKNANGINNTITHNNLNQMNLLFGDQNFLSVPNANYTMNNDSNNSSSSNNNNNNNNISSNNNNNNITSNITFGSATSAFVNGTSGGTFTPLWPINDNNSSSYSSNNKSSNNGNSNKNSNNIRLPDISYFSNLHQNNTNFQQQALFVNDAPHQTASNIFQYQQQQIQQQQQELEQQQQQQQLFNAGNAACDTFSSLLQIESDQFVHLNSDDIKLSNLSIST